AGGAARVRTLASLSSGRPRLRNSRQRDLPRATRIRGDRRRLCDGRNREGQPRRRGRRLGGEFRRRRYNCPAAHTRSLRLLLKGERPTTSSSREVAAARTLKLIDTVASPV